MKKGSFILIEHDVLLALHQFRQRSYNDDEAGGILIGYRRREHLHAVEFTVPAPQDIRSRYEFNRIDPHHADHARKRWKTSGDKLDCIGEWHTHPEAVPAPSGLDRAEWTKALSRTNRPMVFVIVGLQTDWIGVGDSRGLQELTRNG